MKLYKDSVLVICICGLAGVGKDTLAKELKCVHDKKYNEINRSMGIVTSFTTRQPRVGEQVGREHHFVDNMPKDVPIFACAKYGDEEYWVTEAQIRAYERSLYVIDEQSILMLKKKSAESENNFHDYKSNAPGDHRKPWKFKILSILVEASRDIRISRGVSEERMARDEGRDLSVVDWDFVVKNNGESMYEQAINIHKEIMKIKL